MLYWDKLLTPVRSRTGFSVAKSGHDTRTPFKKDFDTVCNSTILRRLQDKAQVFPLEQEDYARTRLTHSIEVMAIAESLGLQATEIIVNQLDEYLSPDCDSSHKINVVKAHVNDIPTILATAALLHDMGNPPFGHLGEQIIRDWFASNLPRIAKDSDGIYGFNDVASPKDTLIYKLKGNYAKDLMNFEGNAQLLRLVTKLSYIVDDKGMNLTYPVMATFIKYPCASDLIDSKKLSTKKMGYFSAETTEYRAIQKELGLTDCRHPLAFLLEAADDIAYLTADIEDAQKKGIISISDLEYYFNRYKNDPVIKRILDELERYKKDAREVGYPNIDDYVIHRMRIYIKGVMIDAMYAAFEQAYDKIMLGECEEELLNLSSVATLAKVIRDIERDKIYYCDSIVENKTRAFRIIQKLLEAYVPAVLNYRKSDSSKDTTPHILYLSLSENYRFVCEQKNQKCKNESEKLYNLLLLVTDQISGMTDSKAQTIYRMITAT